MQFFSPSSGNGRHCPLSTSGTSGPLCARPARTKVGGARLRARLVDGAWAYLWLHTRDLVLLVCL